MFFCSNREKSRQVEISPVTGNGIVMCSSAGHADEVARAVHGLLFQGWALRAHACIERPQPSQEDIERVMRMAKDGECQ